MARLHDEALVQAGVLEEITGKRRDRLYAYRAYLNALSAAPGSRGGERPGNDDAEP